MKSKNWLSKILTKIFGELKAIEPVKIKEATYDKPNEVLLITFSDGSTEEYKGSSTVWHKMPLMERQNTYRESYLCDIYTYIKHYGNPYPTAHLTAHLEKK